MKERSLGAIRSKRQRFFREHPFCCFCGGTSQAVEIDHIPSRAIFRERKWPEGYEFPACERCNQLTAKEELIITFLSRLAPGKKNTHELEEFKHSMKGVANNFPGLLESMSPTHRDLRKAVVKYRIKKLADLPYTQIPVLSLNNEGIHTAVRLFGRKLALALWYKYTQRILPIGGGIATLWYSNLQIDAGKISLELAGVLSVFPKLERAKKSLSDQFFLRWGLAHEDATAAFMFMTMFRRSFAIVGFVVEDPSKLTPIEGMVIAGPFSHPTRK